MKMSVKNKVNSHLAEARQKPVLSQQQLATELGNQHNGGMNATKTRSHKEHFQMITFPHQVILKAEQGILNVEVNAGKARSYKEHFQIASFSNDHIFTYSFKPHSYKARIENKQVPNYHIIKFPNLLKHITQLTDYNHHILPFEQATHFGRSFYAHQFFSNLQSELNNGDYVYLILGGNASEERQKDFYINQK